MRLAMLSGLVALAAGCQDGAGPGFLKKPGDSEAGSSEAPRSTRLVERDIEAPEVFQLSETGLWDGRPSLGGVWVAYADVKDPERVIIRNEANGKFVVGALFRRERETPGPALQVSSDAAEALGMLAGAPAKLNVVALRREEVAETPDSAAAAGDAPLPEPSEIEALSLDTPPGGTPPADAAIGDDATSAVATAPAPAATAPAAPPASKVDRPYVQIGIFSVETNAEETAAALRKAGMTVTVKTQSASGKSFYRVIAGPAGSASEKDRLLAKVKKQGFSDAYFVSN
ncbi:SPOR domain-containing protein [Oceaniglobus roseus]|uniref:SPOR domain-containing protein n=1 Tax=Oceaniglobus roseus TaxID=1737570 RepID=UPI0031831AB0